MRKKINGEWKNVCKECGTDLYEVGQCSTCRFCLNCCKCTIAPGNITKDKYQYTARGYHLREKGLSERKWD